jgi:hypothetical protein
VTEVLPSLALVESNPGNSLGQPLTPINRPSQSDPATTSTAGDPRLLAHLAKRLDGQPGLTYPVTNLALQYDSLLQAANQGDDVAARTLRRALKTCPPTLPRNETELAQIRAGIDAGTYSTFRRPSEPPIDGHNRLAAYLSRCGMVPAEAYELQFPLLARLAEAGDSDARLEYPFAREMISSRSPRAAEYRSEHARLALQYLESELIAGNPLALHAMARSYREGVLRPRDPVLAYTYVYAATLAPGDHRVLNEHMAGHAAGLTSDQIEEARRQASMIYTNCCK